MANELRFSWPGMPEPRFREGGLAGAQVLANLLAAPEQAYQDRIGTAQMRQVARSMGVPEDQLNRIMPGEDTPTPVGGTGVVGKIMSGVGKTGATLSAILGAPVKPPRFGPTEIKDLEEGSARESLIGTLDKNDPDYVKKAAKIRLGKYDEVFPGAPKNMIELAGAEADRQGLTGAARFNFIRQNAIDMAGAQAGATAGARTDVTTRAKIDAENDAIRDWNRDHPNAQRPLIPYPEGMDSGAGGPEGGSTRPGGGIGAQGHYGRMQLPNDPTPAGHLSPYDPRIAAAEDKYNHPRGTLSALFENESNFDPNATGPPIPSLGGAQARGIGQFIPDTAKRFGIDPTNPDQSIDAAGKYLRELKDQYGDYHTALLAYGGGLKSGNYPAGAILTRAAQYREAMAGRAPGGAYGPNAAGPVVANADQYAGNAPERVRDLSERVRNGFITQAEMDDTLRQERTDPYASQRGAPVQVAANVPSGTVSDAGGAAAIGIPQDAVTDQQGNVYARNDLTKPVGRVAPNQPGQMIPVKETITAGGRTTEVEDPRVKFEQDPIHQQAIDILQSRGGNINDPQQVFSVMAEIGSAKRGFSVSDAARAAIGLKPGDQPTPDQARQILAILKDKGGDTGPEAVLARIELQRADNRLLMSPVQKTDADGHPLFANGKPVYAMWTDPQDGQRKPIRPVDVAMTNWMVTMVPGAAQANLRAMMNDPDFHLAAMALNQAQSNLTRWATLKGDAKRIADTERVRMATMVPQPGDTKQEAIDKITLGNQALDRMEVQARNVLGRTATMGPAPAPEAGGAAPAPAPSAGGSPLKLKRPLPTGVSIGQQ